MGGSKDGSERCRAPRAGRIGGTWWLLLALICVAMGSACSRAQGTLVTTGEPFGDITMEAARCASGEHQQFFGAFIMPSSENTGGLVLIRDQVKGDIVQIEIPGSCDPSGKCRAVRLDKDRCSIFEFEIGYGQTEFNGIQEIEGEIEFECELENGSATADIEFARCT